MKALIIVISFIILITCGDVLMDQLDHYLYRRNCRNASFGKSRRTNKRATGSILDSIESLAQKILEIRGEHSAHSANIGFQKQHMQHLIQHRQ